MTTTVECGCRTTERASTQGAVLVHVYPCSPAHKTVADMHRVAGSNVVVHAPECKRCRLACRVGYCSNHHGAHA